MAKSSEDGNPNKSGTPTLQTVDRALACLEYVAECPQPPSVQQMSDALGLNITTCYHLMRSLESRNYLKRLAGGKLVIGNAVGPLYRAYRLRLKVAQEIADIVACLSETTGETAFFSAPEGDAVVLEALVEGAQQLRVGGLFVGMTGNEHLRASGRAILPYLDEARRNRILDSALARLSRKEIEKARAAFADAAAKTRERGWSLDGGDVERGISSVGWPVFDGGETIRGAIGVIVPTVRFDRSRNELLRAVSEAAQQAMRTLRNAMTA